MNEERLNEIEARIGDVCSPQGAELSRELIAEVRRLREETAQLRLIEECIEREGFLRLAGPVGTVTFVNDLIRAKARGW